MEQFLLLLLQHIKEAFPKLSLVAEDCGQLDTEEDTYPVTFPCVLVGNSSADWQDLEYGSAAQRGTAVMTVTLAFDCYDDIHVGSTQEQSITERLGLAQALHHELQNLEFAECDNVWPLSRIKSRDYSLPGHIKVYEQMYRFLIYDGESSE